MRASESRTASLPTFLIVGAAKCGTTSLFEYLRQHPEIGMPVKEPHFFAFAGEDVALCGPQDEAYDQPSVTTLSAYKELFAGVDAPARGEASPSSLYFPQASRRIAEHVPDAQIIAILRDPVERAYSNFLMMTKLGREPHSRFARALDDEARRLEAGWSFFWAYTRLGFYHDQLVRYYDRFPDDQIHVVLLRDLAARPVEVTQSIFRRLDVDDTFVPDTSLHHNPSGIPRFPWLERCKRSGHPVRELARTLLPASLRGRLASWINRRTYERPPLSDDVRRRLRRLYRDDIRRLETLIDRDLSAWLGEA